jgi:hypothetical protein
MAPDRTNRRPPRPIRLAVLAAAVSCLALAMCAHADHPGKVMSNRTPGAAPDAAPAAASPREPAYFPATKAAGPIYPQQGQ